MKKGYIWKRLLRSVISILIIMLIVFTLVYTLVPRNSIFSKDDGYRKLASKPDDKTAKPYFSWGFNGKVIGTAWVDDIVIEEIPDGEK